MYKPSYKRFCNDSYVKDVGGKNRWSDVCNEEQPDSTLEAFKKPTVRTAKSPWIDDEWKNRMVEKDEAKRIVNESDNTADWQTCSQLRNHVTKQKKEETILWNKDKYKER